MTRPKLNLLANFAGTGWTALMGLAFIPFYVRLMGIEAFGLVGFFATLQAALQILDFGLSPTMNREMARYTAEPDKASEARDFVRTLEVAYWGVGIAIGVVVVTVAPYVARHWIRATVLPVQVVEHAVMAMGLLAALQWPLSFYQGGLLGLQRQVLLNALQIAMSSVANGGAVLILWLVSPTIMAFFAWRIATSFVQVGLTTWFLWRSLPRTHCASRFDPGVVRKVWRFAAGMSGIGISALVLTQLDKVVVSKLLTLESFGYYTLAGVVITAIAMVAGPIFNTVFPLFSSLVAIDSERPLTLAYHRSSQLMAVLVLPIAAVVALFSFDLLRLWTGSAETALNVAPIASVLVIGSAFNALMVVPYALQLAYGWTSIGLRINLSLIVVLIPTLLFLATRYGPVGAAGGWVTSQALYLLIGVPLTHRRLLKGEGLRWFVDDVGRPLTAAVLIAVAGRKLLASSITSPLTAVGGVSSVLLAALAAATLVAPETRDWLLVRFRPKPIHT
jgi:O-antigen/teichoic acid export membrane protein